MALTVDNLGSQALELKVDGRLETDDYEKFVPLAEELIAQHRKMGLLVRVSGLRGWSPAALWQDIRFDARHYNDITRIALVAESDSKRWLATLAKPFTGAKVEFFLESELEQARDWVKGG
jgi:hypothetical protein